MANILVVDDERGIRLTIPRFLAQDGHRVETADGVPAALKLLAGQPFDVVITDIIMPRSTGIQLLGEIQTRYPDIQTVVITGEPTVDTAAESLRLQAFDYLTKPIEGDQIRKVVRNAVRVKCLEDENRQYQRHLERLVEERTQRLAQYSRRLRQIAAGSGALVVCRDARECGGKILKLLAENLSAMGGGIYQRRDGRLELLATLDPEHGQQTIDLPPPPRSVLHRLFTTKTGFTIADISRDPAHQGSGWEGYTNGSLLVLPCQDHGGEISLVITLHNKREPPFTPEDLDLGRVLAAHSLEIFHNLEIRQALRHSEQGYRNLIEGMRDLVVVLDLEGRVTYCNPGAAAFGGYTPEEAMDTHFAEYLADPDDKPRVAQAFIEVVAQETTRTIEFLYNARGKEPFFVEALGKTLVADGQPVGLLVVLRDINDRKKAENERRKLEEQFRHSQKMESVGLLAGGIAHDFNNLLQAILGHASLALRILPGESPATPHLAQIDAAGERATRLVSQLLAFSRRQVMRMEVLDLNDLVADLLKMLRRVIGEHIDLVFSPGSPIGLIHADHGMLDQVLINLCINARDAMAQGGRLTLRTANTELDRAFCLPYAGVLPGPFAQLTLSDTGCGMTRETREHIFEPFFTTKEPGKGTGLGLATVYGIIQQHGGIINVESEPGRGTTFNIFLPLSDSMEGSRAVGAPEAAAGGQENILLVEDDTMVRELGRMILESAGYRVLLAANGMEAVEIFERQGAAIDMVIMDVVMPLMGGIPAQARMRELDPAIPILFASGYNEFASGDGLREVPGTRLIKKPFRPEVLLQEVRNALDHLGGERTPRG